MTSPKKEPFRITFRPASGLFFIHRSEYYPKTGTPFDQKEIIWQGTNGEAARKELDRLNSNQP